jgi:hypothetical protein
MPNNFAELVRPADIFPLEPDLRNRDRGFGANERLDPGEHFIESPRVSHHIMVGVADAGLFEILLASFAVGTTLLAEEMISLHR